MSKHQETWQSAARPNAAVDVLMQKANTGAVTPAAHNRNSSVSHDSGSGHANRNSSISHDSAGSGHANRNSSVSHDSAVNGNRHEDYDYDEYNIRKQRRKSDPLYGNPDAHVQSYSHYTRNKHVKHGYGDCPCS